MWQHRRMWARNQQNDLITEELVPFFGPVLAFELWSRSFFHSDCACMFKLERGFCTGAFHSLKQVDGSGAPFHEDLGCSFVGPFPFCCV